MLEESGEEKPCLKFFDWMIPKPLRLKYLDKENSEMSDSMSRGTTAMLIAKWKRHCSESSTTSSTNYQPICNDTGKENPVRKCTEDSGGYVKRLKRRFEAIANQKELRPVADPVKIKKRSVSVTTASSEDNKLLVAPKRVRICDDDVFVKARFEVYNDEPQANSQQTVGKKSEEKVEKCTVNQEKKYLQNPVLNRRLTTLTKSSGTVESRSTPLDILPIPLTPKKVKVQYRKTLKSGGEQPRTTTSYVRNKYDDPLLFTDNFLDLEEEKEKLQFKKSNHFRRQNVTVEQRNIIVKFLIRLNTHTFQPSFILYQAVKLFDAMLDTTLIPVTKLQLTALAAMWIALKREHIAYNVPTAKRMVSFAKELYDGNSDLLIKCEMDMLRSLNFVIVFPDPYSILSYDIRTCNRSPFFNDHQIQLVYNCGSYIIDVSLFDEELSKISIILLVAAAAEIALHFVMEDAENEKAPLWFKWRSPQTSKRYSEAEISVVRSRLIEKVLESTIRHKDCDIVFKKYNRSRYGKISHYFGSKVKRYLN